MAFGDPFQQQHMIAGVKRAMASPRTPSHLRPHLAARLGGTMQQMSPRKTIVAPTVVGSTARPPVKTVVGSTAAPPRKTLVGSTAAPPRKTTAANLGVGSNGPRPRGVLAAPNSAASVNLNTRSLGRNDGNPQRSVAPMPGPAQGAANPVLDHDGDPGRTTIQSGGMGQTNMPMRPSPRRAGGKPRGRSQFFGE
jgi:hypothetical protein